MKRSVIDVPDLTTDELEALMDMAEDIIARPDDYADACRRKKLATLFFEPSTRTRLSFEAAMYELGGNVLSVTGAGTSSAAKGESVADTAKTVSCYADIIAMRHPKEGAALVAAKAASVPVINAMSRYEGLNFVLISPEELKLPSYVKNDALKKRGIPYTQTTDLEQVIGDLDILYMTRVQRERFFNEEDYLRLRDSYILTPEKLKKARADLSVMHPLPRVNEISVAVDDDPRACYFKQVLNGKYMRMALILMLLELKGGAKA